MENISDLITRLQSGEKVRCSDCSEGFYTTTKGLTSKSNFFWCDKCGSIVHFTLADVIVE